MLYNRDPCLFQRNYIIMQKILGVVRFGLLCRIVMDPILSFITDFQVRSFCAEACYRRYHITEPAVVGPSLSAPAARHLEEEGSRVLK